MRQVSITRAPLAELGLGAAQSRANAPLWSNPGARFLLLGTPPQRDHAEEKRMHIECTTTTAAAEVLSFLINAYLRPGREFHIAGPLPHGTPIQFTLSVNLPAHVLRQVQGIPDTRIGVERGE